MLTSDAISVFGSKKAIAEALGITPQAVYQWEDLVPPVSAARLAARSNGQLRFDPSMYERWNSRDSKAS